MISACIDGTPYIAPDGVGDNAMVACLCRKSIFTGPHKNRSWINLHIKNFIKILLIAGIGTIGTVDGLAAPAVSAEAQTFTAAYQARLNACDATGLSQLLDKDFSGFGTRGGLALGQDLGDLRAQCSAGVVFALSFKIQKETRLGEASVVAALAEGNIKLASGQLVPVRLRISWVLVGAPGSPKLLHSHMSQYPEVLQ